MVGIDTTLQNGRAKCITASEIRYAMVCCSIQVYSQVESLCPRNTIAIRWTRFMLHLSVDHYFDVEFVKSLEDSIVWQLVGFNVCLG